MPSSRWRRSRSVPRRCRRWSSQGRSPGNGRPGQRSRLRRIRPEWSPRQWATSLRRPELLPLPSSLQQLPWSEPELQSSREQSCRRSLRERLPSELLQGYMHLISSSYFSPSFPDRFRFPVLITVSSSLLLLQPSDRAVEYEHVDGPHKYGLRCLIGPVALEGMSGDQMDDLVRKARLCSQDRS